jgi:hypothetical protein
MFIGHERTAGGTTVPFSQVPREFLGLARDFRNRARLAAEEATRVTRKVIAPLVARFERNTRPRKEMLIDAARALERDLPAFGRLRLDIDLDRRAPSLKAEERRCSSASTVLPEWSGEKEPGVCLFANTLDVAPGHLTGSSPTMATIGLHALARFYQRARPRDDAEVLACLGLLFDVPPEQEVVVTPRGRWALQWRPIRVLSTREHKRMACARTFLESD